VIYHLARLHNSRQFYLNYLKIGFDMWWHKQFLEACFLEDFIFEDGTNGFTKFNANMMVKLTKTKQDW
jgi:hypothetical protein